MQTRRKNLLKFCNGLGCDTLVAFEPENLYYMTGFWGEAIGILDKDGATIIAPELEVGRAREESVGCRVVASERGKGAISSLVEAVKKSKICTDTNNYDIIRSLKKSVPRVRPTTGPFYQARQIKDRDEIAVLKKCSAILDEMYGLCVDEIREGVSEMELQAVLMSYAMERGAFATGYKSTLQPLIIAGGPNSALPHAQVTQRRFEDGDMIVVDLTLRHMGYVSDATRTFGLGSISNEARKVYEIVRRSQEAGLRAARAGVPCRSVDNTCRKIIARRGYGKFFIHSTGHGIGLEVHEVPNLGPSSQAVLSRNMAVTVEPGIYLPGRFGVRIEDSLIVGQKAQVLHKFPKDLIVL
ncbi:MAG: aminopeptidase P family protein [Thaumarchaeota archaeon]|nr:aminopeptidase P family protein [Nitrososphaerota archaeon]